MNPCFFVGEFAVSHFIFRADGNASIGLGHVMRCLSIADACRRLGHEVLFVIADEDPVSLIVDRGFKVFNLETDYRVMEEELPQWKDVIQYALDELLFGDGSRLNRNDAWSDTGKCQSGEGVSFVGESDVFIFVDSYFVTREYFSGLRERLLDVVGAERGRLVYIDDLAEFPYPVDVLVNYNAYAEMVDYDSLYDGESPELVLGVRYAPLREMFVGIDERRQRQMVKDVLISTGGADSEHLMLGFMEELILRAGTEMTAVDKDEWAENRWHGEYEASEAQLAPTDSSWNCDVTYHMLVGGMNQDAEEIEELSEKLSQVVLHEDVKDMRSLIDSCDVVVSAAGSTLYEVCACGVPMVTYAMADNQIPGAEAFDRLGLAVNVGDLRGMDRPACVLLDAVGVLAADYERRVEVGRRMQEMVDGKGAERLVRKLEYGVKDRKQYRWLGYQR